jgi:hypothetical protein
MNTKKISDDIESSEKDGYILKIQDFIFNVWNNGAFYSAKLKEPKQKIGDGLNPDMIFSNDKPTQEAHLHTLNRFLKNLKMVVEDFNEP